YKIPQRMLSQMSLQAHSRPVRPAHHCQPFRRGSGNGLLSGPLSLPQWPNAPGLDGLESQCLGIEPARFDSISLTYLLHCLPGTINTTSAVFRHLKPLLNQSGVMFGTTLLSEVCIEAGRR